MAEKQMFSTTDLRPHLETYGVSLSTSQVYRLVAEQPERINLTTLVALLKILDCSFEELVEIKDVRQSFQAATGTNDRHEKTSSNQKIAHLKPTRARIIP